ncbi:hypothetical protein TIMSHEL_65 [Mycobacterium phage Timshel]|nr:hypothetical protein FDI10_gp29 [Mycobacterium phage Timshel]AEJ92369.1 hypothetical protein TIMSHEL_65 [Mycobacterium phage Timshel]
MTATPNAMPRKANPLHQIILKGLLDNKQTVRTEVRGKRGKKGWEEREVQVAVPTLAGNVSDLNIDIAAKRWIA